MSTMVRRIASTDVMPSGGPLHPLHAVWERAGVPVPEARVIAAGDVPFRYRPFLVHRDSMTSTLERHGGPVALRVLSCFSDGDDYFRRILLVQRSSGRPMELAAIRIRLDLFDASIRRRILGNRIPLGRLMQRADIGCESVPTSFLALRSNDDLMGLFWMRTPRILYGRRTELRTHGVKFADVLEIVPVGLTVNGQELRRSLPVRRHLEGVRQ